MVSIVKHNTLRHGTQINAIYRLILFVYLLCLHDTNYIC